MLAVGFQAPEKARLGKLGALIFRAEHLAIAALVAGVSVVRQLMAMFDPEGAALHCRKPAAGKQRVIVVRDLDGRSFINEVGVVWANRNALVAVDAVIQPELASDL